MLFLSDVDFITFGFRDFLGFKKYDAAVTVIYFKLSPQLNQKKGNE